MPWAGAFGPCVTVPAALSILRENPRLIVILVGQEALIQPYLKDLNPPLASRVAALFIPTEWSLWMIKSPLLCVTNGTRRCV